VTFSKEARELFLEFAVSPEALWCSNFRDLNGALIRMCTLAPGGRITKEICLEEIQRLKANWHISGEVQQDRFLEDLLKQKSIGPLDLFDRIQLEYVINTCRSARSLSEAGRMLFSQSRLKKSKSNDADRLTKYLAKFLITWNDIHR
jgi:transcriptional regulatory protein RtcR